MMITPNLSQKKSARRAKENPLFHEYQEQLQDLLPKSSKHKKKSSFDINANPDFDDHALTKKSGIFSAELQNKPYLKDVEYMVNPMFSPLNGPPKVRNKSQSHINDADSTQFTNLKKSHPSFHEDQPKTFFKAPLNQFFTATATTTSKKAQVNLTSLEGRFQEGSSETIYLDKLIRNQSSSQLLQNDPKSSSRVSSRAGMINMNSPLTSVKTAPYLKQKSLEENEYLNNKAKFQLDSLGNLSEQKRAYLKYPKMPWEVEDDSNKMSSTVDTKKDFALKRDKSVDNFYHSKKDTTSIKQTDPRDINSTILSAFNNQLQKSASTILFHPISFGENPIHSTRSDVERSDKRPYFPGYSNREYNHYNDQEDKIEFDKHEIDSARDIGQTNSNSKFQLLRKQVQDKRLQRDFKSLGHDVFDLKAKNTNDINSVKQNHEIYAGAALPDTTHTSTKFQNQNHLNDMFFRVKKLLQIYQHKEKAWEEHRKKT